MGERYQILESLRNNAIIDTVIIGGGIHGAASARLAARAGLSTALFERGDYAEGTSSRSSKMAHGGLRYLEMLDFKQVFEGIKARENLFESAPHIVKPARFLIPIPKGKWFLKLKLGIGLKLYDLMVKVKSRRHVWIPRKDLKYEGFNSDRRDLEGCYSYTDGLMNDSRLVMENIRAAREAGAVCLNHMEVISVERPENENYWIVNLMDQIEPYQSYKVKTRSILNCAGPWISDIDGTGLEKDVQIKLSKGIHIIFGKKWDGPSLFLPMEGKARYYFVWPHPAGTMVGTTERQVDTAETDPFPDMDEIDEILTRLSKDLPSSGLNRESAHYCFAGVRTLPLRSTKKGTATLSRKHRWTANNGIFSLVGGKFTTAAWTASEGVNKVLNFLNRTSLSESDCSAPLPGAYTPDEKENIMQELRDRGQFSEQAAKRLITRYGKRALDIIDFPSANRELGDGLTEGELRYAIEFEQAEHLEDLMRRRIDIEYEKGHGLQSLDEIGRIFKELRPKLDIQKEKVLYTKRIQKIVSLLKESFFETHKTVSNDRQISAS